METINKSKLNKKEQIKLLKTISNKLMPVLDHISWTNYYSDYLKENITEEKRHLRGKPEGVKHGLTAHEGGLLFSVLQIVDFFVNKDKKPCFEGYIYCRKSIYTAYSLVHTYNKEIAEALKGTDYKEILNFDYCYLVNVDNDGNLLN